MMNKTSTTTRTKHDIMKRIARTLAIAITDAEKEKHYNNII